LIGLRRLSSDFQGTFDRVFDCESTQEELFQEAAAPAVLDVLKGYNGTILAYGQVCTVSNKMVKSLIV
jgi:kinesin family protein 5